MKGYRERKKGKEERKESKVIKWRKGNMKEEDNTYLKTKIIVVSSLQYCKAFCQTLRNSSKHTIFSQATHHNPRNAALYKTKHFQEWGQSAVGKGSVHYIAY